MINIRSMVMLSAATLAAATTNKLDTRGACGAGPNKVCYGLDGGESQNLDPEDVQYVADYLRYIGDNNQGAAKFWTMPKAIDCAEWSLPVPGAGTVLALAEHVNARISSSILYEDLASTIDGGKGASVDAKMAALAGCGANGGQLGVKVDKANPLYNTVEYRQSGAIPDGIIVKLVKAPPAAS
ncbi:hypothetical protein E4U21_004431 [Claviceps maximensis]|nr:hypothetical protein E4U21_004431 [Claviceps maximensis]